MADSITATLDATGLIATIAVLDAAMQRAINDASQVSAHAIAREAAARLKRQLGPNATGLTEAGITSRPAFNGNGWVVLSEREPFPNLPLWIEKGTKHGKPRSHTEPGRPYFYVSADLERGAHAQRIENALHDAIVTSGLGD